MKYINIIGLILILFISTIGNHIAPGRYCTYLDNDTLRACGPTSGAENDKNGTWVYLDKWGKTSNLSTIVNYKDNLRQGWQISFQTDSMQTKDSEIHYVNDTIDGDVRLYNAKGQRNLEMKYGKGVIYDEHFLIYDDYAILDWIDGKRPAVIDSLIMDMVMYIPDFCPFMDESISLEPSDTVVVFNSWTNKITYIIIAISSILLILNILNIKNHANKRNQ